MNCLRNTLLKLVLLSIYSLLGTHLGAGVFIVAAEISGAHTVQVQTTASGLRVVLHHSGTSFTPRVTDHGQSLARVLTCLCAVDGRGDHVFEHDAVPTAAQARSLSHVPVWEPATEISLPLFAPTGLFVTNDYRLLDVPQAPVEKRRTPLPEFSTIVMLI
jgi:hypothetical protein